MSIQNEADDDVVTADKEENKDEDICRRCGRPIRIFENKDGQYSDCC